MFVIFLFCLNLFMSIGLRLLYVRPLPEEQAALTQLSKVFSQPVAILVSSSVVSVLAKVPDYAQAIYREHAWNFRCTYIHICT